MNTKINPSVLAALFSVMLTAELTAQNNIITYQGRVQSGGSNFTGTGQFKFALVTSTNVNSAAAAAATVSGGFVTIIDVTDGGNGYVTPPAVSLIGGGGSGATATAQVGGSMVTNIVVASPGSDYTSEPLVQIDPPPGNLLFTTYWSNDGSSVDGSGPADAVSVPVNEGLFTVRMGSKNLANMMPLSPAVFQQPDLELRIWFDDGVNGFAALSPTQPLTAAPYALNTVNVTMGTITDPGFLGTTTKTPLDFQANNRRALRLEYVSFGSSDSVNIIGGYSGNTVSTRTAGAVVAGGGRTGYENTIGADSDYAVIGGGVRNTIADEARAATISGGVENDIQYAADGSTIGGGANNDIEYSSYRATIAGGAENHIGAGAFRSTIGGGYDNSISDNSSYATIAGGQFNRTGIGAAASGGAIGGGSGNDILGGALDATIAGGGGNRIGTNASYSTVGGGNLNDIADSARYAVIPGGRGNGVGSGASYALAAGRQAQADHQGVFIWADSIDADFASSSSNQFLIRATGGVGIGKNDPATTLDVNGTVTATAFSGNGSALSGLPAGHSLDASDGFPANSVYVDNSGNVGIGTTAPKADLHVRGSSSTGKVTITPSGTDSQSQILLTENSTASIGMILRYAGDQSNNPLHIIPRISDTDGAPVMTIERGGDVGIGVSNPTEALHVAGNILATGTINGSSDRNVKEHFAPVDPQQVLDKVAAMPIQR